MSNHLSCLRKNSIKFFLIINFFILRICEDKIYKFDCNKFLIIKQHLLIFTPCRKGGNTRTMFFFFLVFFSLVDIDFQSFFEFILDT